MGKKKIDTHLMICDQKTRDICYCKRKRGLVKKAIELSMLCGQDIMVIIFDKSKQKLVEYRSNDEFSIKVIDALMHPDILK